MITELILTLHLHQEFSLNPASCLTLILAPGATQRVNLVNKDDGWPVLSGQLKQILHQPIRKAIFSVAFKMNTLLTLLVMISGSYFYLVYNISV